MTTEEYNWLIKIVQDRYYRYKISFEQAEKIKKFENQKSNYSTNFFFSPWEEWDYEMYTFQKILKPAQLRIYKEDSSKAIKRYEKSLKEQDKTLAYQISYKQAIADYYRKSFWPDLYKDRFLFPIDAFNYYKTKIAYLKAAYMTYLNDRRIQILSNHFREYRQLQPNQLKISLLQLEISHLWPDYFSFEQSLDEPGKVIANYLVNKKIKFPDPTEELVKKKIQDMKVFTDRLYKKYFKHRGGWTVNLADDWDDAEKRKHILMPLLLADRDEYGWEPPL